MAASPCDGSYRFWHQGQPVTAAAKSTTSQGVETWENGLPILRLLTVTPPVVVLDWVSVEMGMPVRRRSVVAYGSD